MKSIVMVALLLLAMDADASVKDDALLILEKAGLEMSTDPNRPTGCAVAELGQPTKMTKVSCMGPDFEDYTRRAWDELEKAGYVLIEVGLGFSIERKV